MLVILQVSTSAAVDKINLFIMDKVCTAIFLFIVCLHCSEEEQHDGIILQDIESYKYELLEYTKLAIDLIRRFISWRTNALAIIENSVNSSLQKIYYHTMMLETFLDILNYTITAQLDRGKTFDLLLNYNIFLVAAWTDFR